MVTGKAAKARRANAKVLTLIIGAFFLLAAGVAVHRVTRGRAARSAPVAPHVLLFTRCAGLITEREAKAARAAVLFAHHADSRFSLPMAVQMAAVAGRSPGSTVFVIVTPEPDSLASKISGTMDAVAVVGGDWLDFAPRTGDKLILPALVLLREPGEVACQWVGNLDGETLTGLLEAFAAGMEPEIFVPGEGDRIPQALKDTLAAERGGCDTSGAHGLVLIFIDPSCNACGPFLDAIAEHAVSMDVRSLIVASGPVRREAPEGVFRAGAEVILDSDLELFSAMRVSIVPTLVLADTTGSILARVDGIRERKILDGVMARFRSATDAPVRPRLIREHPQNHAVEVQSSLPSQRKTPRVYGARLGWQHSSAVRSRATSSRTPAPPCRHQTPIGRSGRVASSTLCYFFVSHECGSCQRVLTLLAGSPIGQEFFARTRAIIVFEDAVRGNRALRDPAMPDAEVIYDTEHDLMASLGVVNIPTVVCVEEDGREVLRWFLGVGSRANAGDAADALLERIEREFLAESRHPSE